MNEEAELLQRYLDGELTPDEARGFEARLALSAELRRQLRELEQVGSLVRGWADEAELRAGALLEPTLARALLAEQKRGRQASMGVAVAALLLVLLPASAQETWPSRVPLSVASSSDLAAPAAAIERLEAVNQQAQVFVVGRSSTPVVWLVDDAAEDDALEQQDPG